jgi:hypothetical protein
MAYYNRSITGSWLTLPYVSNWNTYRVEPLFVWQRERPAPTYDHEVMRVFYTEWEPNFQGARSESTLAGWFRAKLTLYPMLIFFTLLLSLMQFRQPGMPLLSGILAVFLIGLCLQRYIMLHYVGPIIPAVAIVFVGPFVRLSKWRPGRHATGRLVALLLLAIAFSWVLHRGILTTDWFKWTLALQRAALEQRLAATPGRHIVLVRYGPKHRLHDEWVYNAADIDASRIIWARDMGRANRQLQTYYPDRKIWLLEPDQSPIQLREAR